MSRIVRIDELQETPPPVKILDARSKVEPAPPAQVRVHTEVVTEDDKMRKVVRGPGEPEVRVIHTDTRDFDKIKRGEEDE